MITYNYYTILYIYIYTTGNGGGGVESFPDRDTSLKTNRLSLAAVYSSRRVWFPRCVSVSMCMCVSKIKRWTDYNVTRGTSYPTTTISYHDIILYTTIIHNNIIDSMTTVSRKFHFHISYFAQPFIRTKSYDVRGCYCKVSGNRLPSHIAYFWKWKPACTAHR